MREFKDSITGKNDEEDRKPQIEGASETDKVEGEVVTEHKA
jgi:hypothetical protein